MTLIDYFSATIVPAAYETRRIKLANRQPSDFFEDAILLTFAALGTFCGLLACWALLVIAGAA